MEGTIEPAVLELQEEKRMQAGGTTGQRDLLIADILALAERAE